MLKIAGIIVVVLIVAAAAVVAYASTRPDSFQRAALRQHQGAAGEDLLR